MRTVCPACRGNEAELTSGTDAAMDMVRGRAGGWWETGTSRPDPRRQKIARLPPRETQDARRKTLDLNPSQFDAVASRAGAASSAARRPSHVRPPSGRVGPLLSCLPVSGPWLSFNFR